MSFQSFRILVAVFIAAVFSTVAYGQHKVQTFGTFLNMGTKLPEKPTDFKTTFQQKKQVYVQLTYPTAPEFYTVDCYWVVDGQEKMRGTTDIKCFDAKSSKPKVSWQSLGMMYDAGDYKIRVTRQSDKQIVAESEFTVTEAAAPAMPAPVAVTFCDDTDDNFNPIKPVTTIKAGQGVNFLAKLKQGIGAKFFIWAVFEIKGDNDELMIKDLQENVDNETNRWFATVQKTIFSKPGKYAVYMLQQNATNVGMTSNKPTKFYARGVLEVK